MTPSKTVFALPIQIKVQTTHRKYRMHRNLCLIGGMTKRKPRAFFLLVSFAKQTDELSVVF